MVKNAGETRGDNVVTVKNAIEIGHNVKSAHVEETSAEGAESKQGENSGVLSATHNNSNKLVAIIQENKITDLDINNGEDLNEILVNDPK